MIIYYYFIQMGFWVKMTQNSKSRPCIDHFARCKQHWSRSTSCFSFLTLHKSWDKIQPTEHIKLNQKVKQLSLRCFLYMWKRKQLQTETGSVSGPVLFTSCNPPISIPFLLWHLVLTLRRHWDTTFSGISGKRCLRSCSMW